MLTMMTLYYIFAIFVAIATLLISNATFDLPQLLECVFGLKCRTKSLQVEKRLEHKPLHTSVWCFGDIDGHKLCTFRNIYYAPVEKQFLFVLTEDSILSGINTVSDLQFIELSSLSHSQFILNVAIISKEHPSLERNVIYISDRLYIFMRFKRDNIMHVIHDDLLPLFNTYLSICVGNIFSCVSKYQLAFLDGSGSEMERFTHWYEIFSDRSPMYFSDYYNSSILCLHEARVGLLRSTTWFQYGFSIPQGPLNNTVFQENVLLQFTNFVAGRFGMDNLAAKPRTRSNTAVVFSRKINRLILNEKALCQAVQDAYSSLLGTRELKMFLVDLSINGTSSILKLLRKSKIVIGMHGAEMILSIFLPRESLVLEMFPLGIIPDIVSPLKALSQLPGIKFHYESWQNINPKNSIAHPEALPIVGGISHLSVDQQQHVKSLLPLPAMVCCHNPAYLYRMYQDTIIDVQTFTVKFKHLLEKGEQSTNYERIDNFVQSRWWFPAIITNLSCHARQSLLEIRWNPSINIKGLKSHYEIMISNENIHQEYQTEKTKLNLNLKDLKTSEIYVHVWVKCVVADKESLDSYVKCILIE